MEERLKAEYGEALGAALSPKQTRQERRQKGKKVNINVATTYPSLIQQKKNHMVFKSALKEDEIHCKVLLGSTWCVDR